MRPRLPGGRPMPRQLRRRILRQIDAALANIEAALAGGAFRSDDERHASLAIVRMAPSLFRTTVASAADEPPTTMLSPEGRPYTEAEAKEFIEGSQAFRHTREECPQVWAERFREHGPQPGDYETLEEAQAYGLKVCDRIHAKYGSIADEEPVSEGSAS